MEATSPAQSTSRRRLLTKDNLGDGNLTIREFCEGDNAGVEEISWQHFRSLSLSAVRYYIAVHFLDLIFLVISGVLLCPFRRVVVMVIVFHVYLFVKAHIEMDQYIRRDCNDLRDINSTYMMSGPRTRFWVAEVQRNSSSDPSTDEKPLPKLAGCIGLVESRENPETAKLVRLLVDSSHRRMRIGSRLLLQLENYAREVGYTSIVLYTNSLNPSHVKFVRQHSYTMTQTIRRGLMRGDLICWYKNLNDNPTNKLIDTPTAKTPTLPTNTFQHRLSIAAQTVMD